MAFVTGALILTGCSGGASSAPGGETSTVNVRLGSPPTSFATSALDNSDAAYVWTAVYGTLLMIDNDGAVVPNAANWQYNDNRTLTLSLRDDLTFSSGESVTSEHVKDNLEYIKATPGANQSRAAFIETIDTPDAATVILNLSQPDSELLINLATTLGVLADPGTLDGADAQTLPQGAGPYTINEEKTRIGSRYVLELRDNYWNAAAYPFKTLTATVVPNDALVNALQAGEVDAAQVEIQQTPPLEAAGLNVTFVPNAYTLGLTINDRGGESTPALGDARVRQAINMAFDREMYVSKLFGGKGTPTVQKLSSASEAYDSTLDTLYPYDPAQAKSLLAQAGYPNGFSVAMPSASLPGEANVAASLAEIGITVNWEPVPMQDFVAAMQSKRFPMVFTGDSSFGESSVLVPSFSEDGRDNPFSYTTPELNELFNRAVNGDTGPDGTQLWADVNRYTVEQALAAPIVFIDTPHVGQAGYEYVGKTSIPTPRIERWAPAS